MVFARISKGLFAPPKKISMPAAGFDISDHSIKYMEFEEKLGNLLPVKYEKRIVKEGIINEGNILDVEGLIKELKYFRKKYKKYKFANISLPEELAYVFDAHLPKIEVEGGDIRALLEYKLGEFIPLNPDNVVFDFEIIRETQDEFIVGVLVYPLEMVEEYVFAMEKAGFMVKSAEMEIISMSRATVKDQHKNNPVMVVDFGNSKVTIAIVINDTPVFTSTIKHDTKRIFEYLHNQSSKTRKDTISDIDDWKFKQGLFHIDADTLDAQLRELSHEMLRYIDYWSKHKEERFGAIKAGYLTGGNASVKGLDAYLAKSLNIRIYQGDVWQNMFDKEEYLPAIDRKSSFMFATLSGLGLRETKVC